MKKYFIIIVIIASLIYAGIRHSNNNSPDSTFSNSEISTNDQFLEDAFNNEESGIQVRGSGRVIRILSDDNEGSRHQKFIIELGSGQTLLISHNIDIAPRINSLSKGNQIDFCGEYEWNSQGGVVHWAHHDPDGSHEDGWLKHDGRTYQ
ncbi:MAG: DUF3465 domain-containing protein [Desulfobacteraceae bacterium]|jgi:hypothetical protein